ncbi:MAG: threonylcarbamoyl-AMP synthase [Tissierellia bacterium]|nr:L-threonylcarbamoyladenylate synthase [Bacillota bacterium]NLL23000.1 threonylcarbamoyl-AMP synthase [Tissierellia bacterium]
MKNKCKTKLLREDGLMEAVEILLRGDTLIFPTETVYGLGARFDHDQALRSVFEAKGRPADNPLILHVADASWVEEIADDISPRAHELMKMFWPGPLSLVLKKKDRVSHLISAGLPSVAVRCPSHPLARRLLQEVGVPVAAPSANPSGRPSPTREIDVLEMVGKVGGILLGGDCEVGLESTVLDLSGERALVLRPGAVTTEELKEFLPEVERYTGDPEKAPSPGLRYRHYAPDASVIVLRGSERAIRSFIVSSPKTSCFLLPFEWDLPFDQTRIIAFVPESDLEAAASQFYALLRDADKAGMKEIYVVEFPPEGIGEALTDRVWRASGGRVKTLEDA